MHCIFIGTSEFAVPALRAIIGSRHSIALVITQPDRPKGRGRKLAMSPVKSLALEHGLDVFQPEALDDEARREVRDALVKAGVEGGTPGVGVTVAYGLMIPPWLLDLPKHGLINLHPSDVPKFRGAAPIQRTLMAGEKATAVCVLRMGEGLDDGPVLAREVVDIDDDDDFGSLSMICSELGGDMIARVMSELESGSVHAVDQSDQSESYASKITAADRVIDWSKTSQAINGQVRGLSPKPGASTSIAGKSIKVLKATHRDSTSNSLPGTVIESGSDNCTVKTGDGAIGIDEVQPEGRSPMSIQDYLRGTKLDAGQVFGE